MSMYNLGNLYENGDGGLPKDEIAAFKMYKRAIHEGKEWPDDGKRRVCLKLSNLYAEGKGTMRNLQKAAKWMERANEEGTLPVQLMGLMEMLRQLDPGKKQSDNDDNWRRMCKYIDDLPEQEKPKTYKQWELITKKFGYVPSNPIIKKKEKSRKCNFPEFLELCGGSFNNLEIFEMQDTPVPPPVCAYCKTEEEEEKKLKNCVRCREKYCSKECQRKDWKSHKKICDQIFAQIGP